MRISDWSSDVCSSDLVYPVADFTGSGGYGDATLADEFYWAAAELFVTTGAPHYRAAIEASPFFREPQAGEFGWPTTATMGTIALATLPNALPEAERGRLGNAIGRSEARRVGQEGFS